MAAARKGSPVLRWGHAKIVELFGADLRSLAVFRMVLAVLVLGDLARRVTDLSTHYADNGILPRSVLLEEVTNRWWVSLSLLSGEPFFQALLFGVAALAALGLLVGYRTRSMTVVVWVMLISIQWRNPLVLSSADTLSRVLLFWGMFLPLGAYWSVDHVLKARPPRLSMRFLSFATVGLLLQIAFMYWVTAILKSGEEWRVDGTAIYYTLSIDQITTQIGAYLYQFPTLLMVLTFATILLEAFGPFLLFSPILTGPVRTGAVLAFMGLHFGVWLTLYLGMFPWISALCMVCFLPGWFWDSAAPKLGTVLPKQHGITRTLRHTTSLVHTYWLPLRERLSIMAGAGRATVAGTAIHDDEPAGHAKRATAPSASAAIETKEHQGEPRPAASATAGQELWHRGAAGSEQVTLRSSLATNLIVLFFLLYVLCWNLMSVSEFRMPQRLVPIAYFLDLEQSWDMFTPYPAKDDGWYVIPGTLRGGQRVDLMAVTRDDFRVHEGVSWEKPRDVAGTYKNVQWRQYLYWIREPGNHDQFRQHFGLYICREWNARHAGAEQLRDLQIIYMYEETLPSYQLSTPQKVVLWEHTCS